MHPCERHSTHRSPQHVDAEGGLGAQHAGRRNRNRQCEVGSEERLLFEEPHARLHLPGTTTCHTREVNSLVPTTIFSRCAVQYGPEGPVKCTCALPSDRRFFSVHCQGHGTFTAALSCLPVDCGGATVVSHAVCCAETCVISYVVEPGITATDGLFLDRSPRWLHVGRQVVNAFDLEGSINRK